MKSGRRWWILCQQSGNQIVIQFGLPVLQCLPQIICCQRMQLGRDQLQPGLWRCLLTKKLCCQQQVQTTAEAGFANAEDLVRLECGKALRQRIAVNENVSAFCRPLLQRKIMIGKCRCVGGLIMPVYVGWCNRLPGVLFITGHRLGQYWISIHEIHFAQLAFPA